MGVYERNDSIYWWVWIDGQKRPFSTKIPIGTGLARKDSREKAENVYRAAMGDLARGRFSLPQAKPLITFAAHALWYETNVSKAHRSYRREKSMLKHFVQYFGHLYLHEVTPRKLEEWKAARALTHHKHTVNREIDVLKPFFASAIPEYLDTNPAANLKRYKARPTPITILSPSAERALLQHASPQETAMVLLGLDALLRLGDVRTLRTEHDKGSHLEIVNPKTDPYKVPVSRRLRAALDALTPQGGYYFPRKYKGKWAAMGEATAFDLFAGLCERANVLRGRKCSGITFHSLRHTGATRAARVVKLTVVKELGGWKSLKQLGRYDHPDAPELIRAVEAIGHLRDTDAGSETSKKPAKHAALAGSSWRGRRHPDDPQDS